MVPWKPIIPVRRVHKRCQTGLVFFLCICTPFNRNAGIPLARTGHRCGNDYRQRRVTTSCKNCVMGFVVSLLIFNRAEIGEDFFVVIHVSRTPREERINRSDTLCFWCYTKIPTGGWATLKQLNKYEMEGTDKIEM